METIDELIKKCEKEIEIFERVSAQNGKKLLAIVQESNRLEKLVMPKITDDVDKIFNRKDMWQSFVEGHTIDGIEPRLSTLFDNWIYDYIKAKNESNFTG